MATSINKDGTIELFSLPDLAANIHAGFITKLQDKDGIVRRSLTYLVTEREPERGLLSWEMQALGAAEDIDISTLKTVKSSVLFKSRSGKKWDIPVDIGTGSFLVHFRANTDTFNRISFYNVLNNNFDPRAVKDKIVLIGSASSLLGDIHLTPVGWLPGITLNANALLNLYSRDFIREVPYFAQWLILIMALGLSAFVVSHLKDFLGSVFLFTAVAIFFILSYLLLTCGYILNYAFFPALVFICPMWAKGLYNLWVRKCCI